MKRKTSIESGQEFVTLVDEAVTRYQDKNDSMPVSFGINEAGELFVSANVFKGKLDELKSKWKQLHPTFAVPKWFDSRNPIVYSKDSCLPRIMDGLQCEGTVVLPDGSTSGIYSNIQYEREEAAFTIRTFIENPATGKYSESCIGDELAYISIARLDGEDDIEIGSFYVHPNENYRCTLSDEERSKFKGIGELIFGIAFRRILSLFPLGAKTGAIHVVAEASGEHYAQQQTHSNCLLLDRTYRKKYGFQEVSFNNGEYMDLNDEAIKLCGARRFAPHIRIRTTLESVAKVLSGKENETSPSTSHWTLRPCLS